MNSKAYWGLIVTCLILALIGGVAGGFLVQKKGIEEIQQTQYETSGLFSQVCTMQDIQSKRASTWNQTGANTDKYFIPPGEKRSLLTESGSGCIKHIYWTYVVKGGYPERAKYFRGVVMRMFWDGSETPSVEVPIGDLFGVSNGQVRQINSLAFAANPGHKADPITWAFNCYLPMPFSEGAQIELENQADMEIGIWVHIDYELYDEDFTIPDNVGRLHALWNRENPTTGVPFKKGSDPRNLEFRNKMINLTGDENYSVLDIEGDGQFVGYFLTVFNFQEDPWTWWGEGDDMIFIDGEGFPPSFHGTGTEEIFAGAACPSEEFTSSYAGFHCIENWNDVDWLGTNGMYRFHIQDPIRFQKSIRLTLEHGHGNNKFNDYSTVAFWYQKGINTDLPSLPPFEKRLCTTMPPKSEAK